MKKPFFYLLAAAGIAVLGWWAYGQHRGGGPLEIASPGTPSQAAVRPADDPVSDRPIGPAAPGASGNQRGAGANRGPVGVEAVRAQQVTLVESVAAVGSLRANESVVVKPEVAGRIDRIQFEGGARVKKGDLLIALDASVPLAEAEQTRAELGLAQANYQRTADLARQQFVSGRALDEAGANLKVLEAKLKLAEARLAKTELRAPFAGVVGLRNVSVGDFVREGAELVALEDVSQMKVDLRLPERYMGQLRRGQRLEVEFDAYPGKRFNASLEAVDVVVDANGRSVIVRGRLANNDGLLRTGMFAKVALTLSQRAGAVMVPEEAIFPAGQEQYVFRIDDGKAMRIKVRTGLRRDGKVEIVEGVRAGDQVVTAGQLKLTRDAMEVRVIDPPRLGG